MCPLDSYMCLRYFNSTNMPFLSPTATLTILKTNDSSTQRPSFSFFIITVLIPIYILTFQKFPSRPRFESHQVFLKKLAWKSPRAKAARESNIELPQNEVATKGRHTTKCSCRDMIAAATFAVTSFWKWYLSRCYWKSFPFFVGDGEWMQERDGKK